MNAAGTVASPASFAAGAVTAAARRRGAGATVTGRVMQGGQPRAGAERDDLRRPASEPREAARTRATSASGTFSFRARTGVFFRANVVAAAGPRRRCAPRSTAAIAPVPVREPDDQRVHRAEPRRPQEVARRGCRGGHRPAPTIPRMPATVQIGICSFADEGCSRSGTRGASRLRRRGSPTTPSASARSRSTRPTTTCPTRRSPATGRCGRRPSSSSTSRPTRR